MLGRCRTSLQRQPALEEPNQELHPWINGQNPCAFLHSVNEESLGLVVLAWVKPSTVASQRAWITWGS